MVHEIFYVLHILGMAGIIGFGTYLFLKKELIQEQKKKFAGYFMSAAHIQLLTGFILFFLMLAEVNHMKIGIKMLIAIEIAVVATIYKKKISLDKQPNSTLLPLVIVSGIVVTAIAFLW